MAPRTHWTKDSLWAELDETGEGIVRERLATSFYGDVGDRRSLVELWLATREADRRDASHSRQAEAACRAAAAAERAAAAAERQARAAEKANTKANVALVIAAIGNAIAIAALIVSLFKQG